MSLPPHQPHQQQFVYFQHPTADMQQQPQQFVAGSNLPPQQQPFVYYPQVVMGQNGQPQYVMPPPSRYNPVFTTPIMMDQQGSSNPLPLNTLQQVESNTTSPATSCSFSRLGSCSKFSKIRTYAKENKWVVGQLSVFAAITFMCLLALILSPYAGLMLLPKALFTMVCCIAAYKKKYLALSFMSGAVMIDMAFSAILTSLFAAGNSYSRGYHYDPVMNWPFLSVMHILELSFLIVSLVLTAKIHREVHSTAVPAQENVVPVLSTETPVANNTTQQEDYSRLQDEQESQPQEAVQRYYPSLNNNQ